MVVMVSRVLWAIADRERTAWAAERERADRIEERDRLLAELDHRPWWRRFGGDIG